MGAAIEAQLAVKSAEIGVKSAELDSVVGALQDYTELKVDVDEVGDIGKKNLLNSSISVPADKYALLQEQAKAYRANKSEIENVREKEKQIDSHIVEHKAQLDSEYNKKSAALQQRETSISTRERRIINLETSKQKQADFVEEVWDLATRGVTVDDFVQKYVDSKRIIAAHDEEITCLKKEYEKEVKDLKLENKQITSNFCNFRSQADSQYKEHYNRLLNQELKKADEKRVIEVNAEKEKVTALENSNAEKDKLIDNLREISRGAYECFRNAINAVKTLKYGKDKYKVESLSLEQGQLIDGVVDYSVKWAKEDGFPEVAADMKQYVGISEGLQECIDARKPQVRSGGRKM